ncbi:MAG: lamin tail domain-containing protein [Chloroflexi bacterium]|nr:lamin tail domain-containing protein [Chloroflexota bacterium]
MHRLLLAGRGGPLALLAVALALVVGIPAQAQTPLPAKPALLLPPPAFTVSNPRPTLSWQMVAGISAYDIQVDNNADFSSPEQTARVIDGTRFTAAELPNGRYYWRVRSVNGDGVTGEWSQTRQIAINTALPMEPEWMGEQYVSGPQFGIPAGQPTGQVVINEVCTEVCDGTGDTVELYNAGTTPVDITNWRLTLYITLVSLGVPSNVLFLDYYLPAYVLAPNDYVSIVEGAAPGSPDPDKIYLGPNNNIPYVGGSAGAIMLRSTAPTGIDFVRFRGSTLTSTVAPPAGTTWLGPDPFSNQSNDSFGRDAFSLDTNRGSDWSQPQNDTINAANQPPAPTVAPTLAPVQTAPAANAIFNGALGFNLRWNPVPNATVYHWELYATACTGSPIFSPTTTNLFASVGVSLDGVFYWRVRAENPVGNGPWSTCRKFTVDNTAPTVAPMLISPTGGVILTTPKPLLKWSSVAGAARYEVALEYGDSANPETIATVTTTSFTVINPLQPSRFLPQWYWWRVRALDTAGNAGPWSGVTNFDVATATGAAPTLNYSSGSVVILSWLPVSWANGYELQVDDSSTFTSPEYVEFDVPRDAESWIAGPLPRDGLYYWRIRAKRDDGTWGGWSSVRSFVIRF